jgi:hypothetical protein
MAKSEEVEIEIKVETKSISELKSELRNLKSELANATDPKDMLRLASAAGEVQDKLTDVNEKIKEFASGSDFEKASNSLKGVGAGLANLDFGKAQESAQAFAKSAGAITFKQAITSVKQFGQTMATIGKALLTNPLFLIGAIVAVIVVALYEFLDSLGLIKKAMDLLMLPLDLLIEGLKEVASWLGINTTSAKEFAEENKKMMDQVQKDGQIAIDAIQFEIDKRKAAGEETFKIEREKQAKIRETAEIQIGLQKDIIKNLILTGQKESEEYENAVKIVEENVIKVNEANKAIRINAISENKKRTDDDEKAEEKRLKAEEVAAAKRKDAQEKEAARQLELKKQIEDSRIALMEDGITKEIKKIKLDGERRREAIKGNSERDIEARALIAQQTQAAIDKVITDAAAKEAENQRKNADNAIALGLELKQKKIDAGLNDPDATPDEIRAQYNEQAKVNEEIYTNDLKKLKERKEREKLTDEEYAGEKAKIDFDYQQKVKENQEEGSKNYIALKRAETDAALAMASNGLNAIVGFMEEGSEAGKAVAVAQTTIDTWRGAQAAYASAQANPISILGPAYPGIMAGIAVATGLANVKKILSTKKPTKGSTPSAPSGGGSVSTPTVNTQQLFATQQLQGAETEQITSGGIGQRQQPQVIKAVVSERDVTAVQNRISNYEQRSEIG